MKSFDPARKLAFSVLCLPLSWAIATPAWANDAQPVKTLPNDKSNFIGDTLKFEADTVLKSGGDEACLRTGDKVKVIGHRDDAANPRNNLLFVVAKGPASAVSTPCRVKDGSKLTEGLVSGRAYDLPVSQLVEAGMHRSGYTYGMLMVPFKYVLAGDRGMRGASTVGGYVGWRQAPVLGMDLTYIGFAGATVISIQKTENGVSKTTDNAGLSAGFGAITTLKDSFQVGAVAGWDVVSSSANYGGDYKPWVAIQIGYSFLQ